MNIDIVEIVNTHIISTTIILYGSDNCVYRLCTYGVSEEMKRLIKSMAGKKSVVVIRKNKTTELILNGTTTATMMKLNIQNDANLTYYESTKYTIHGAKE